MDGLIEGRIVHYVVDGDDMKVIKQQREETPEHSGNPVMAGEHFPAIITRVFPNEYGPGKPGVNLKVFLDGTDQLWVTSVQFAEPADLVFGTCHWIERA